MKKQIELLKNHGIINYTIDNGKITIKDNMKYWLQSYIDEATWSYKVSSDVECLSQVRKHIIAKQ